MRKQTILVTGAAGFIGFHLCESLLKQGYRVVGLDNINDYYNVDLKYGRLKELGIHRLDAAFFFILNSSNLVFLACCQLLYIGTSTDISIMLN